MHSVSDPARVRFTGPSSCATGLVEELARLGYATTSATSLMQLTAHLSRWLGSEGIDLGEVSGGVIERFVAVRRATYANHYSAQALRPVLTYLRREGLVPAVQPAPAPSSPVELLFLTTRLPSMTRKTAQMVACALQSFLRFLHHENYARGAIDFPEYRRRDHATARREVGAVAPGR